MDKLLDDVTRSAIKPALAHLPLTMASPTAIMLMLAIGLQESGLTQRVQVLNGGGRGPARGLWQNERGGGVLGVLTNPVTKPYALKLCEKRSVQPDSQSVWQALESDDILAAGFARLIMYADPSPLPQKNDVQAAWRFYAVRTWRPGHPRPFDWPENFERARDYIFGEAK